MEDFARLNLGLVLSVVGFILTITIVLIITLSYDKPNKQYKKWILIGYFAIVGVTVFFTMGLLARQASVNNIPRSVIDRSATQDAQEKFQSTINKNSKKE